MCGGIVGDITRPVGEAVRGLPGGLAEFTKMALPKPLGTGEIENSVQQGVHEMLPGLSIMALPFAAAGGAALAGGAEAGGGSAAGGSLFGPGAADALDASLIGPDAGAAAGSGSQFAPAAVVPPGDGGGGGDVADGTGAVSASGTGFIDATTPTNTLSPETAQALGVNGGVDSTNVGGFTDGVSLGPGGTSNFGESTALVDSTPVDIPSSPSSGDDGLLSQAGSALKSIGLSPASAGLLGVSAAQALSKPKIPQAARTLQDQSGPAAQSANATIQSGGTASPAWTSQKASIDATIDEQIKQQIAAMTQQAINSGQGADSQVTQQQINKIKNQLETQRQTLYAQAQAQNVQAALQQLGISDQALSSVANQQFQSSNQAKQSAAQTAQTALMLEALSKRSGSGASVVNQGSGVSA